MDLKEQKVQQELAKLNEAEKAWKDKLDNEIKSEDEIIQAVEDITNNLYLNNKTRAVVNNTKFIIGCKVTELPQAIIDEVTKERKLITGKVVVLIISNEDKYKLLGQKYVPAMVKADYDERYDARANIRAAVEGWVRHVTNTVKPEMLD